MESEQAADTLFGEILLHHGVDEARRISAKLAKLLSKTRQREIHDKMLLALYDAPPPLGRNVERLVRHLIQINKTVPLGRRIGSQNLSQEALDKHIRRLLKQRSGKA